MALTDDGRLFIAQKTGAILVWTPGSGLLAEPFHVFAVDSLYERGLVGLAIDPEFASTRRVYAYYTRAGSPSTGVLVHLTASLDNPNVADPLSETPILEFGALVAPFHVGGAIRFGPDGKLYMGVGENTISSNSQSVTSLFGKILRLNRDGTPAADNPESISGISGTTQGVYRAIWAAGLRNPFTFAFQPGTGRMFINDVGAEAWEEIDEGASGRNFGWPATEGDFDAAQYPAFTRPVYALSHDGDGAAIVGGVFYNPREHTFPPGYHGAYFFCEFIHDWIKRIDPATREVSDFGRLFYNPVDLIVEPAGSLLVLTRQSPVIKLIRIQYTAPLAPAFLTQPSAQYAGAGDDVHLDVYVSGNRPLTYTWSRDGVEIADGGRITGATTARLTISAADCSDRGEYTVVATNAEGTAWSNPASLIVDVPCRGDYNCDGGDDGSDVEAYFTDWEAARASADVNADGGIDGGDLEAFFFAWESGC